MAKSKSQIAAEEFVHACNKYGWTYEVRGSILTIHKRFTAGSNMGFTECDMLYSDILSLVPRTRPGSDWGTDGGGIGGITAVQSGHFVMNRSGGDKRILKALARM